MRVITVAQSCGELHLRHSEGVCSGYVLQETGLATVILQVSLTQQLTTGGAFQHVQDDGGNTLQGSRASNTSCSQWVNLPTVSNLTDIFICCRSLKAFIWDSSRLEFEAARFGLDDCDDEEWLVKPLQRLRSDHGWGAVWQIRLRGWSAKRISLGRQNNSRNSGLSRESVSALSLIIIISLTLIRRFDGEPR